MSAATLEDALRELWLATPALIALVPAEAVFIGFPTLRKLRGENREILLPVALIREGKIGVHSRSNDGPALILQNVQIAAAHSERRQCHAIMGLVRQTFDRFDGAWSGGSILDLKPVSREEKQEPDGIWLLAWNFNARFTIV